MDLGAWMQLAHEQMVFIEARRTPALDLVFIGLTALGTEAFLLFFAALGYWLVDRVLFARAAAMIVVAGLFNTFLKGLFLVPRPDVSQVLESGGYSFPSGHAQVAAALWGWLAIELARGRAGSPSDVPEASSRSETARGEAGSAAGGPEARRASRRWLARALWVLAALIAASRPYLGVHYPHDVVVGFALGALQVAVFTALLRRGLRLPATQLGVAKTAVIGLLLLVVLLFAFHPDVRPLGARLGGAGIGLMLGLGWARTEHVAGPPKTVLGRTLTVVLGVVGLIALWLGLKVWLAFFGLEDHLPSAFVRYALVGAWITVGAPALVAGLRLR